MDEMKEDTGALTGSREPSPAVSAVPASIPSAVPHHVSRQFHEATEALLDWMNSNDLAWDHANQRPHEFQKLCDALEAHAQAMSAGTAETERLSPKDASAARQGAPNTDTDGETRRG